MAGAASLRELAPPVGMRQVTRVDVAQKRKMYSRRRRAGWRYATLLVRGGSLCTVAVASALRELAPSVAMRFFTRVDVAQNGATPLFVMAQEGHEGCAKLLLEAKAAVDAANKVSGRSAATLAEWRAWEG